MDEAGGGAGGEGTLSLLGKWTLDVVIGVVLNESIITGGCKVGGGGSVSYTHLTLPTICSV